MNWFGKNKKIDKAIADTKYLTDMYNKLADRMMKMQYVNEEFHCELKQLKCDHPLSDRTFKTVASDHPFINYEVEECSVCGKYMGEYGTTAFKRRLIEIKKAQIKQLKSEIKFNEELIQQEVSK